MRVALRQDLRATPQEFGSRQFYVIEDPLRAKFYRLGEREYRLLGWLDGSRTIRQAIAAAATADPDCSLAESEALALVQWVATRQLTQGVATPAPEILPATPATQSVNWWGFLNLLCIQIPLGNPNRLLKPLLPWTSWLFTWMGLAAVAVLAVAAGASASLSVHELTRIAATILHPKNWLVLLVIWLCLKVVHELGHAVACKKFGADVRQAGISLILFAPIAYVDVTPAWRLPSKWQRIAISAAGMYVEGIVACLALLVWSHCRDEGLRSWARQVFFMASLQTLLVNANPLLRFDGYFILSDLWELPNLQAVGTESLVRMFRRILGASQLAEQPLGGSLRWLVPMYAVMAMGWKVLLLVSVTAFLLSWGDSWGSVAALAFVTAWLVMPVLQVGRFLKQVVRGVPLHPARLAGLGVSVSVMVVIIGFGLSRPAMVIIPAVVEYKPLTTLRAPAAGFVRQVCVASGEEVRPGDPIVVMENDELLVEAAELRCQIQSSELLEQSHRWNQELAKRDVEDSKCRALLVKLSHLESKIKDLTIRAPKAGRIVARRLDELTGKYLAAGDEIALIASEDDKELILAVPQNDLELFQNQSLADVQVRIVGSEGDPFLAQFGGLEPSARAEIPHPALSGAQGGPIAVREVKAEEFGLRDSPRAAPAHRHRLGRFGPGAGPVTPHWPARLRPLRPLRQRSSVHRLPQLGTIRPLV